jgi:hypothetical protein
MFLRAFAKFRKATISVVLSARPSVHMQQRGSHCMDFIEILYVSVFRKPVGIIQFSLKPDINNEYFT